MTLEEFEAIVSKHPSGETQKEYVSLVADLLHNAGLARREGDGFALTNLGTIALYVLAARVAHSVHRHADSPDPQDVAERELCDGFVAYAGRKAISSINVLVAGMSEEDCLAVQQQIDIGRQVEALAREIGEFDSCNEIPDSPGYRLGGHRRPAGDPRES